MTTAKIQLTAQQLATLLVLEGACAQLQTGANQLGAFLGLKREADVLVQAIQLIDREKQSLTKEWERTIQIVGAGALPKAAPDLRAINGDSKAFGR